MHELGIMQQVISIVQHKAMAERTAEDTKVTRIVVEVGKLSAVLPDALRFCFEVCAEGTLAQGAALEIVEVPGTAECRQCGEMVPLERPFGRCACGSSDLEWLSGEELRIKEMELG